MTWVGGGLPNLDGDIYEVLTGLHVYVSQWTETLTSPVTCGVSQGRADTAMKRQEDGGRLTSPFSPLHLPLFLRVTD